MLEVCTMSLDYRIELDLEEQYWMLVEKEAAKLIADGMDEKEAHEHAQDIAVEKMENTKDGI
jgi:hypothetical protein